MTGPKLKKNQHLFGAFVLLLGFVMLQSTYLSILIVLVLFFKPRTPSLVSQPVPRVCSTLKPYTPWEEQKIAKIVENAKLWRGNAAALQVGQRLEPKEDLKNLH